MYEFKNKSYFSALYYGQLEKDNVKKEREKKIGKK